MKKRIQNFIAKQKTISRNLCDSYRVLLKEFY